MRCEIIHVPTDEEWVRFRNTALVSQRKTTEKVPSSNLKLKYLFSEHSPLYTLQYTWEWKDIPYWICMHFKTHHEGIFQITSSQRNDILGEYDRRKAPQDSLVNQRGVANPAAIIGISRKRLCLCASKETREAWELFLKELKPSSPELVSLCVKPCVYRNGICPEVFSKCRFNKTKKFEGELQEYKNIVERLKT